MYGNVTESLIESDEGTNARCAGVVLDSEYKQVVVAFEVETNIYSGVTMDTTEDWVSPIPIKRNWNVLLQAFNGNRRAGCRSGSEPRPVVDAGWRS